ncbi:hypothetical protein D3C87_1208540 [compost metagenome]
MAIAVQLILSVDDSQRTTVAGAPVKFKAPFDPEHTVAAPLMVPVELIVTLCVAVLFPHGLAATAVMVAVPL